MHINHACLVCLGSNVEARFHLKNAQQALESLFDDVLCGDVVLTKAEGNIKQSDYLNQAIKFMTVLSVSEVKTVLKKLEKENGRTPEDKQKGCVPLDIDLIIYDGNVLRPNDLTKHYVKLALASFRVTGE